MGKGGIIVIDYGMGNLGSIVNMLKKAGAGVTVSSDLAVIETAEKLILPGVGAFDNGMNNLSRRNLIPLLNKKVLTEKTPILGLCLGMQLFTRQSEEGVSPGLGWIDAKTVCFKFDGSNKDLKIPHMGWNDVQICRQTPLWDDKDDSPCFYFAHSYHLVCADEKPAAGTTTHGYPFTSVVHKENIAGVQFHPEKSHKFGMKILRNFAERF